MGLSEPEVRSAVLLAILAIVIYPALPVGTVDRYGLIDPRPAWITVILIAGIGFINYVLWNLYGNRGIELTGFLGGLVNSTVTVGELAGRVAQSGHCCPRRLPGDLARDGGYACKKRRFAGNPGHSCPNFRSLPFALMLGTTVVVARFRRYKIDEKESSGAASIPLSRLSR